MMDLQNQAAWERVVRVVMGGGLLALVYNASALGLWTLVAAAIGTGLFMTGLAGWCPLRLVLRMRTSKLNG